MMMQDKKKIAVILSGPMGHDHDMKDHKRDHDDEDDSDMSRDAMKMAMGKFISAVKAEDVEAAHEAMEEWHDISHGYEDEYPGSRPKSHNDDSDDDSGSHNPY